MEKRINQFYHNNHGLSCDGREEEIWKSLLCNTVKSWRHLILTRYLRNLTLCFCGLRSPKLSVVVITVVVPFFSFWFSEMLSGLNLSYSYSHGEWRTDRARQLFFLQALNVYLETSFLLGLLKWAIAVLASYLRQESCYCFSTALQQQTCNDLVYTLYHMIVNT